MRKIYDTSSRTLDEFFHVEVSRMAGALHRRGTWRVVHGALDRHVVAMVRAAVYDEMKREAYDG